MQNENPSVALIVLIVLALAFLFPFVYLIGGSLKSNDEALTHPANVLPSTPHWENFAQVFQVINIPRQTLNSCIMAFTVTFGQIIVSALAGYAFARIKFMGRDLLFLLFLATLIVPFEILFVPLYIMLAKWRWINTYWALIVPSLGNPFAIFVFRQFFLTVPTDLEEAMFIDGAGYVRIFFLLMLPLSGPAVASVFILTWLAEWSTLLKPLVFTTSKDMYTLQVGLNFLNRGAQVTTPTIAWLLASVTLASIPAIVMFLILQKRFVESIAQSGLK